jgi:hypothetical protein
MSLELGTDVEPFVKAKVRNFVPSIDRETDPVVEVVDIADDGTEETRLVVLPEGVIRGAN